MNRRRLVAALGASVLAVLTLLGMQKLQDQEFEGNSMQSSQEASPDTAEAYPLHENIITTVFWVGEDANKKTNDNIHNSSSVWTEDWVASFGGIDDPNNRCGYVPCGFKPKENPFYFALPFNDYNSRGLKPAAELEVIPWYDGQLEEGESYLKNRWIEITYQDKKVYAQWQDAGPFGEDDAGYVFGEDPPAEPRAGLDVSPAVMDYLGFDGRTETSWKFVDASEVPDGPWKEVVTTAGPEW